MQSASSQLYTQIDMLYPTRVPGQLMWALHGATVKKRRLLFSLLSQINILGSKKKPHEPNPIVFIYRKCRIYTINWFNLFDNKHTYVVIFFKWAGAFMLMCSKGACSTLRKKHQKNSVSMNKKNCLLLILLLFTKEFNTNSNLHCVQTEAKKLNI